MSILLVIMESLGANFFKRWGEEKARHYLRIIVFTLFFLMYVIVSVLIAYVSFICFQKSFIAGSCLALLDILLAIRCYFKVNSLRQEVNEFQPII